MKWIDHIVAGLEEEHGTLNVYEICYFRKILILEVDPSHGMLEGHEAFYVRNRNNREVILISNALDEHLKEFILKHELGHAICHPGVLSTGFTYSNKGKYERQANYFAFKLNNINFDEIEFEGMTIEQIACCLKVPLDPLKQITNIV